MSNLAMQIIPDESAGDMLEDGPDERIDEARWVHDAACTDPAPPSQPRRNAGAEIVAKFRNGNMRITADVNGRTPAYVAPPRAAALAPTPLSIPFSTVAPRAFAAAPLHASAPTDDDFLEFVATNDSKFIPVYAAQLAGERWRLVVCWPALFVPLVWLLYRKMYAATALVTVTPIVLFMLHCPPLVIRIAVMSTWILVGFGRHIYVWSARLEIADIRASASDDATALNAIRRAGGVSRAGAVIGVVLTLCIGLAISHPAIHH